MNSILFQESEVIKNAFDVFIKTPQYDEHEQSVSERLRDIRTYTQTNDVLTKIISVGKSVLSKFTLTNSSDLKKAGLLKSLISVDSIFELPDDIKKFQPLMDKEYSIEWTGWKNEGFKYDDLCICPFCTNNLDENHEIEKKLFVSSYTKSNIKNIKEMISYFDDVREYMDEGKSENLYSCIKNTKDEETIILWIKRFRADLEFLVKKVENVLKFNSFNIKREDISTLDEKIKELKIDFLVLEIFNNAKVKEVIDSINSQLELILNDILLLKRDIGQLKGLINSATEKATQDINEFLYMSGVNYRLEISVESENNTKTTLKYVAQNEDENIVQVQNIKSHLSWGERNAFALVLFMHHAISKNPSIIVLDDPISSFDSNKKYAIINRLFVNEPNRKSFFKKTVLMLTHDFQPVIDFIVNNKPNSAYVKASFLKNSKGIITETPITQDDIKALPILLVENSKDESLNKVHRIVSLRKFLEISPQSEPQKLAYNLLSCLLHGNQTPTYRDETVILPTDVTSGELLIKGYIADFNYTQYVNEVFNKNSLIQLFISENNMYFRLQVFRTLVVIMNLKSKITNDPLMKYIDEQFHVENDYICSLNFDKYNTVPDFVIPECIKFLQKENVMSVSP
ncbi:MAG: AAA family ATPase [Microcystis sp. M090S1]|uniref:AAA family ATPase n=1 Tax=unclassified Microcystis TaxID=2643300 RepID=UPI0025864228|nr:MULTISPECIES: AAA family ATPase [unclassified Microcystis]MCA6533005.1 AAA family ATPase [Pseudanabaena sp. M176S2SP2A07QC]MCA6540957.1 AAA family ATPase [Pseudanabaena sp. M037S2SP2A07QC]MCA6542330.1 AAA family ATPase [Pseudanabaena sp. M074S1SP2A07QC]MCA6547690.1 AAA family ATPase [Pseudanabaena sp. M152S2SP2A07QC]MCA6566801.1 AAA family ATPase [Pseudanabaena sp. M151S2SP2A07QC]MCA6571619.1 AAA family ATPase [Pseudanabaena sp. M065S1SP2A07QC]MCA6580347.1 AAA family ATPase [Pseudanabaena